ncbi:hypothetical protein G3M83_11680 [Rouxiella badensis]|uniref:hypothetical protein n=1 Tax=Rouxiella badensis TaxID=1646377 RepID=UPI0013EEFAFE|nr:hypothetical protein [Rouxiella badensis]QII38296.1 hypothetical protein G3M83_11680 [Rouxiella badensis]
MTSHYLVFGGTGMLLGVVKELIKDGNVVSIISRGDDKFRKLSEVLGSNNLYHLSCDYHDIENLKVHLKNHTKNVGFFDFSLCWVHEPSEMKVCSVAVEFTKNSLWQVVGSSLADPSKPEGINHRLSFFRKNHPDVEYRIIILGFFIDNRLNLNNSRWLSNFEISDGINVALKNDIAVNIIGTTVPWSLRPSF